MNDKVKKVIYIIIGALIAPALYLLRAILHHNGEPADRAGELTERARDTATDAGARLDKLSGNNKRMGDILSDIRTSSTKKEY